MLGLNSIFNKITGKNVDKRDKNGETRLYKAVKNGDINTVKKLLRDGADPNIPNAHNLTPLHHACYWGDCDVVDALLKAGADVHQHNGKGWTAMHSAAVSGGMKSRSKVITLLRKAGAKDDAKDKHGWTPADYMIIWEENVAAAEKLKQFLQIPNGLSPKGSGAKPQTPAPSAGAAPKPPAPK